MASLTQHKKRIRKRKVRTEGKERKRALKSGSTPRFPIHLEEGSKEVLPQPPGSGSN